MLLICLHILLNFELKRSHGAICPMECDADVYPCTGVLACRKILLSHRTIFFLTLAQQPNLEVGLVTDEDSRSY